MASNASLANGIRSMVFLRIILLALVFATSKAQARTPELDPTRMPNGTWIIETQAPLDALSVCDGFLPHGSKIRIDVEGPTRRAVEEDIKNQLGVTLTLLPPLSVGLCKLGVGEPVSYAKSLCADGKLQVDSASPFVFDDAVMDFSRLTKKDIVDRQLDFYTDRGAKLGSSFARLWLWQRSGEWNLWLQSRDRMISKCVVELPGKNNFDSFPMIWRRVPGS